MGKHKQRGNFIIGDDVVIVSGPFAGREGKIIKKMGFFTTKYILEYKDGRESTPIPITDLAHDIY